MGWRQHLSHLQVRLRSVTCCPRLPKAGFSLPTSWLVGQVHSRLESHTRSNIPRSPSRVPGTRTATTGMICFILFHYMSIGANTKKNADRIEWKHDPCPSFFFGESRPGRPVPFARVSIQSWGLYRCVYSACSSLVRSRQGMMQTDSSTDDVCSALFFLAKTDRTNSQLTKKKK